MEKCERCGGDIAVMPTICWKCFYSFLGVKTPEQREVIKEIESNFAEILKPLVDQLDYELGSYHEAVERIQMPAIHPPTWSVETLSKIKDIIDNTLKEKGED